MLLCAGLLLLAAFAAAQKEQQSKLLLEQATKKELIDGDLKSAIEIYQQILNLQDAPRAVVAKALLHLGQCNEKLGNAEARKAYERIVRDFSDQPEEARAGTHTIGGPGRARYRHEGAADLGRPQDGSLWALLPAMAAI